jgi:lysine N6-hydroxylase
MRLMLLAITSCVLRVDFALILVCFGRENVPMSTKQSESGDQARQSIIAVGAGPSNLSLAALAAPLNALRVTLLERTSEIRWHSGMQFDDAELQVSYLKDLVTLVDPTSRFSFLSFLKSEKRIYRSLVANRDYTSRLEFERYIQWVAKTLPDLQLGVDVDGLTCDRTGLKVHSNKGVHTADHVVVGVGRSPKIPDVAGADQVGVHSADFLHRDLESRYAGKRVAVIGGGQSGAEIVSHLLRTFQDNIKISWICNRANLLPLDDTPFINEQFFPNYIDYFAGLDGDLKEKLVTQFRCTSDGISERTLSQLYRQLYDLECVRQKPGIVDLHVATSLQRVIPKSGWVYLELRDELRGQTHMESCDEVVYATGYSYSAPQFLHEFIGGTPELSEDRSVVWSGSSKNRIFVQNSDVMQYGLAEPNLSLLAWRAAGILNEIGSDAPYDLDEMSGALKWQHPLEVIGKKESSECLSPPQHQYS